MKKDHLIIVGAGMVGPAAALILKDKFARITILEKRANPTEVGEKQTKSLQIVISAKGWQTIDALGLREKVESNCMPLHGRTAHQPDKNTVYEPYGKNGETIFCISRKRLHFILLKEIRNHKHIEVLFESEVTRIDERSKQIHVLNTFDNSIKALDYDLVIGADGVVSSVAQHLNSGEERCHQLEDVTYREITLKGVTLNQETFHYGQVGQAMIGAFPINSNDYSVFMVHDRDQFDLLCSPGYQKQFSDEFWFDHELNKSIHQRLMDAQDGFLGSVKCQNWHKGNELLIIGDAAHAILPFMGQGLNTGLGDVFDLHTLLEKDYPSDFEGFVEHRKKEANAIREISAFQFRYLTHRLSEDELHLLHQKSDHYKSNGLPSVYEACAFTLESFAGILEKDRELEKIF
jgi:kynurenine 3-monooxygenase